MCSSGSPATGLMVVRGPATSSSAGATHRSVPRFSRAQASSLSRTPLISGQASTATVSASKLATTSGTLLEVTDHRDARDLAVADHAGHAGGHHLQAVVALPAEFGGQIRGDRRVAHDHRPAHAAAQLPAPVQPLPQREPGQQVKQGRAGQRHQHVTAGQIGPGDVGRDRDRGGEAQADVQYPAELIRAHADEARVVSTAQPHQQQPEQRQAQAERQVLARQADGDRQSARRTRATRPPARRGRRPRPPRAGSGSSRRSGLRGSRRRGNGLRRARAGDRASTRHRHRPFRHTRRQGPRQTYIQETRSQSRRLTAITAGVSTLFASMPSMLH